MNPIKQAMRNVYNGHGLSHEKKVAVLKKVKKRKNSWIPAIIATVIPVAVAVLVFVLLQPQSHDVQLHRMADIILEKDVKVSSMERKLQFQQIIADGEVTQEEKMEYLRTSDWQLQLALENGVSNTYTIAEIDDGVPYASLLFYMREFIYEPKNIEKVASSFEQAKSFDDLSSLVPILEEQLLAEYMPASTERMPAKRHFSTLPVVMKVVLIVFTGLLFSWTVYNVIRKRNLAVLLLQLIVLVILFMIFTNLNEQIGAIDETTILTSTVEVMDRLGLEEQNSTLVTSATFDNTRIALVQHEDASHTITIFNRYSNDYLFGEINSMIRDKTWASKRFIKNNGQTAYIYALMEGHKVTRGEVIMYDRPLYNYEFTVEPGKPMIEAIYLPQKDISVEIKFYDAQGERVFD